MRQNHLPKAVTCHDGIIRVNLDSFNGCQQIELLRNDKPVLLYNLADPADEQPPSLTLKQLKTLQVAFLEYLEIDRNLKVSLKDYQSMIGLFINWLEEKKSSYCHPRLLAQVLRQPQNTSQAG